MHAPSFTRRIVRRCVVPLAGCIFALGFLLGTAIADPPAQITRVEEDWELIVGTPDPNTDGPQLTCSIAPVAGDDALYASFELNHRSLPSFTRGGMQLQVWSNEYNLANNPFPHDDMLDNFGEAVTWTMVMKLSGENVTFEVRNGNSTTWGSFGGQGYLRSTHATDAENLNAYSPDDSVVNSGVSFASNRVQLLTLKRVRYFTSTGDVWVDENPRSVHQLQ
jgi:hypothetical protein